MGSKIIYRLIYYPGRIGLNNGSSFLINKGQEVMAIIIQNSEKGLEINDFSNEILASKEGEEHYSLLKNPIPQILKGFHYLAYKPCPDYEQLLQQTERALSIKSFLYTRIVLVKEFDYAELENQRKVDEEFNYYLTKFISLYKQVSKDNCIKLPNNNYFHSEINIEYHHDLTPEDLALDKKNRLTKGRLINFNQPSYNIEMWRFYICNQPQHNYVQVENGLKSLLVSKINDKELDFINFINSVTDKYSYKKDLTYIFLEIFMYLENSLSANLYSWKLKSGISRTKLEKYEKEITISYMLNVELVIALQDNSDETKEIIGKVNTMRTKRNDIVHKNQTASDEEVLSAIQTAKNFMKLLFDNDEIFI